MTPGDNNGTGKEWQELRHYIITRLDDLGDLEKAFVELRIQFTEVKTKVVVYASVVAMLGSAAVSWLLGGK